MTRLFLSLYAFIAISLIVLSAGLERIFFAPLNTLSASQQAWLDTFEVRRSSPQELTELLSKTAFHYTLITVDDLAVADSIASALQRGEIVHGFSDDLWQIYVPISSTEVFDVRLELPNDTANSWWLYSGLFFILLGVIIAVWMYPLWRDLTKLIYTTRQLKTDGSLNIPKISSRSPLKGIATALKELSLNVKTLLQNQRELSGAITHEFRTPLARLKFALADNTKLTDEQLAAVRNDIDELDRLIQEMLDFTRLDVHQPELHIEDIPLFDLCEQSAERFRQATLHRISVIGDKPTLTADGHLITRAIDNLLSNAIRHTTSQVCITIEQTSSRILVHVDDDGSGIAQQHKKSIFDPFFRPDSSRSRSSGGAGLGLAIVKRIQHWHSGECVADDSPLKGARITLSYPLAQKVVH